MNPTTAPSRAGILAGGNWIVDHVKLIDAWPPQDALANIVAESWANGGSPYNILKDLAKLGAPFPLAAAGLVGDDADGERILADCAAHGIETGLLRRCPGTPTSYSDVMTDRQTGRRTFFHQRGANARLGPEHFDFRGRTERIFHLGYLLLLDRLDELAAGRPRCREVLARARAAGMLTSVDCVSENSGRFQSVVRPALPDVDWLFANDFEAERITGVALREGGRLGRERVEKAAEALIRDGVRQWVILHAPEAAYARHVSGAGCWQPSLRVPAAVIQGTAGAGDAFAGGVLFSLHEQRPMPEALRLGVCAAASCLSHPTCSEGVREASRCLQLEAAYGWQELPG
ncbi:MAG: carbohydrate kinase family protein [Opitutaceae bacterium]|nr:carbohydrate kinase family protein [Opitutaceae bacterium]